MHDIFDMQHNDYAGIVDSTGFDPAKLLTQDVDQHFAVLDRQQRICARCSIWWRKTAVVNKRNIGAIGHYSAADSVAARALLEHACREIKARGCGLAIGPLDGNTWRRYRFITDRGSAKPFFLEPDNPDEWPQHFVECGFNAYAQYVSELNRDIEHRQPELGALRSKFADIGVTIEPLDLDGPAEDLHGIYRVVCEAFAESLLFTPLAFDDFVQLYAAMIATVDPQLMLIARHRGRIVGFIFSPPDYLQDRDPAKIDTIVIKTIAILPEKRYSGLGRLLIVEMLGNAIGLGYRQAISALMYGTNRSQTISSGCAGRMRSYRIFAREMNA